MVRCRFRLLSLAAIALAALASFPVSAEIGLRPAVVRATDPGFGAVPVVEFPALDLGLLATEDSRREARGEPFRFAVPHAVFLTPENAGTWDRLPGGIARWRLRLRAAGAASLNLGFARYRMPPGGRLLVYAADGGSDLRPFTAEDNQPHGELWTPVLVASDLVVEVTVPEAERGQLELALTSINQGYRGFGLRGSPLDNSCNVDVVCPEGNSHRDVIRSVAHITIGGFNLCSGAMLNNTAQDFRPLFLTANHCLSAPGQAPTLVVYWLFENSTCRPVGTPENGGPGDGSLSRSQSGSTLRATHVPSDFTLLELSSSPASGSRVFWAGWDRSGGSPTRSVAIHHPLGREKRITLENDASSTTSYLGASSPGDGTHIRVQDWDLGTTLGGSSGSPLFNQNKRVVGQLHGGFAACSNDSADWYGRLSVSWTGGGGAGNRLSTWLDPAGTGPTSLGGNQPGQVSPPAAPSNLAAQAQSSTEVLLTWQDNSGDETQFRIEARLGSGAFSQVGTAPANSTSRVVTGLLPASTYGFRVRAANAGGNSAFSNVATAATPSGSAPPAAPEAIFATTISGSQVHLAWEDRSTNETGFEIEVRTAATAGAGAEAAAGDLAGRFAYVGGTFASLATLPAGTTSYVASGLSPDTVYNFRVRAGNSAGNSAFSREGAAMTEGAGAPQPCAEADTSLCLLAGRFRVSGFWNNFRMPGAHGDAMADPSSNQTGFFWFFNPAVTDLVVKMIDASSLPDSPFFWVFYGALSDVEYWIVVTDTANGNRRAYYNPPANVCGVGDTVALPGIDQAASPPAARATGVPPAPTRPAVALPAGPLPRGGADSCAPDADTLCLFGSRFAVEVEWVNQHAGGTMGVGGAVPSSGSDQTGYFWFFNPAAIDLVVKTVDGTQVNGHFWFFFGGLSDVEYTLTVTDTASGNSATYHNDPGDICGGADVEALEGP